MKIFQKLDYFIKIYKIPDFLKLHWSILELSDPIWATEITMQFFKFLLISTHFEKLPLADISEDQQVLSLNFSHL